ncbi:MAG: hypothetical protein JST16_03825 [Bdellovibrionales bacterium]|nr:hypothetical protein [Bdellovibrionales bacterium]
MQPIYLTMGRSTVLRFDEKPKTAVIGNQNYFSLEYIGSDLTIQPLGTTTTNLFVYTESQTYGLILKVGGSALYDDLVHVHFRPGVLNSGVGSVRRELVGEVRIDRRAEIKGFARVTLQKLTTAVPQGLSILDLEIENLSKEQIAVEKLKFEIRQGSRVVPINKIVAEVGELNPTEETKVRIIVRAANLKGTALLLQNNDNSLQIDIVATGKP